MKKEEPKKEAVVEEPPQLTNEDEALLDQIWDSIGKQQAAADEDQ